MMKRSLAKLNDATWPKDVLQWMDGDTLLVSVPFTWLLPAVRDFLTAPIRYWHYARVGGPAVDLMPDYLTGVPDVTIGGSLPGVLQRANPLATRTTTGCIRSCGFCGIGTGKIEPGGLKVLDDWPVLPVVCDNNILASPIEHLKRVCALIGERWGWADFNQGLDMRLLDARRAALIAGIGRPVCRLALDSFSLESQSAFLRAFGYLQGAGVPKCRISAYAIVGFHDSPREAWERCEWIDSLGIKAYPMRYHRLDALEHNAITDEQLALGWTEAEFAALFGWFYQHRRQGALRGARRPPRGQMMISIPK